MAAAVDDYPDFCKSRGEEPEKSAQLVVRVEPILHNAVVVAAKTAGSSLNKWIAQTLERAVA